jgi:transcriptional regulator with XRE-family HTH domain
MATDTREIRMLLREALDAVRPNLRELGDQAGVTHHAIRQYRLGARTPSPQVLRRLAGTLRYHARKLERYADRLVKLADRND